MKKNLIWGGITAFVCLVALEITARFAGLIDFPLYEANSRIGYAVKPDQSGSFMNRNDWEFNSLGMGAGAFTPERDKTNILVVGDSIVLGGNSYRKQDRLGTKMEKISGFVRVWPISAGSWALQNELTWLESHPKVISEVEKIYFVLNSGDFAKPSSWKCETTHPTHRPFFALLYLFQKYVWDWSYCDSRDSPEPVLDKDWHLRLKTFLENHDVGASKAVFFLYPDKKEYANKASFTEWCKRTNAELTAVGATNVVNLFENQNLPDDFYADAIHPSVKGITILAETLLDFDGLRAHKLGLK